MMKQQTSNKQEKSMRASLMNPEFKYIPASSTDIRKTFERIKKEMEKNAKQ